MSFLFTVATEIALFAAVGAVGAWLWNRFGELSLCHAAAMGSGAFIYARAAERLPTWSALALAMAVTALLSAMAQKVLSRTRGEDYALSTFAIQLTWTALAVTATSVTGGVMGISGVASLFPRSWSVAEALYVAAAAVLLSVTLLLLGGSSRGFRLGCSVSARSSELARTLGVNEFRLWVVAACIYGGILGITGAIWAAYLSYISPEAFSIDGSVSIVAIAAVGRKGLAFSILASLVVVGTPEILRLTAMSGARSAAVRLLLSGAILALTPFLTSVKATE